MRVVSALAMLVAITSMNFCWRDIPPALTPSGPSNWRSGREVIGKPPPGSATVTHRGPDCLGFVFEGKPRRPFLSSKADELGVPFGPERSQLVAGETLSLPDGRRVTPDEVLGPLERGAKLVVVGDAGRTDDLLEVCRDADMLVIESTYLDEEAEMAKQFSHLTARMGAELAIKAGVKKLVLTHLSRRYREKEVLAEAQSIFPGVSVARDFDVFQVKKE